MRTLRPVYAALSLALAAAPLAAQGDFEAEQKRLWFTAGASVGSAGISCVPKCEGDRQTGPAILLRGAGQLSQQFAITLEVLAFRQGVTTGGKHGTWNLNWYMLGAMWYPAGEDAVFLNGGVGLSTGKADIAFPTGSLPLSFANIGATFGLGRDIRFRSDLGVTTYVQYHTNGRSQALIGRANSGARVSTDFVSVGLAVSFF